MNRDQLKQFVNSELTIPDSIPVAALHYTESDYRNACPIRAFAPSIDLDPNGKMHMWGMLTKLDADVVPTISFGMLRALTVQNLDFDQLFLTFGGDTETLLSPIGIDPIYWDHDTLVIYLLYMDMIKDDVKDVELFMASKAEQCEGVRPFNKI